MRFRILAIVLVVSAGLCAQQSSSPQGSSTAGSTGRQASPSSKHSSTTSQQAGKNDQQSQNQLVGCLSQQGNRMVLMQPRQSRWYQLRGNNAQLQQNVGKMVKVTGQLVLGQTSAFNVRQVQVIQEKCQMEATPSPLPATGKTGPTGEAETVTSTRTVEQTTPGVQTARGVAQDPAKGGHGATKPSRPTESQGAPPNAAADNPEEAQRIANAAQQSELSSQQQLGVNAQPNYSNADDPQANSQAVANTAQQERGQASGSDNVFKGGEKQAPAGQNAQNQGPGGAPVVTGCLTQDGNQYWLSQQGGSRLRVQGDQAKLKDHVNHMVQIVGNKSGTYGPAIGTSGDTDVFRVQAIQDVAPTCQSK